MILANSSIAPTPQFRVLSDAQCHELFQATLQCLQQIGILVKNPHARQIFAENGAIIDGDLVRIPSNLVEQALRTAPRQFSVWGRDGGHELQIVNDRVHFGPGPTCTYFIDPETGERRKARRGDAALTAQVCEALPNIDYVMGLSLFDDVPPILAPVFEFAEMMANTTKPVLAWSNNPDTFEDIYEIAAAYAGSREAVRNKPNFFLFTTYDSPLRLSEHPTGNLLKAAEYGLPAVILGGPTFGLESPFSSASALVLHLSCALAGLTLMQLVNPGTPVIIGGVPSAMDLRTARPSYGSPEMSLHSAAAADLARFLNIPFMGTAGATESKLLDAQAGAEAAVQVIMSVLSGASLVHDVGFLDCADIGSLHYLVLVDELAGMAARIMRGVPVSRETIMLDLIEKVGPGGNYLAEPTSAALCRKETWVPTLFDRNTYITWVEKGQPTMDGRIDAKLKKILASPKAPPPAETTARRVAAILAEAEARESK